jgi:tetraacyldisaccharide 4'-kinase
MKAPKYWENGCGGLMSALLSPLGWLFGVGTQMNQSAASPIQAPVPVLCIGNAVVGGAGKTPIAIDIGKRLLDAGVNVHYLSRGYGGSEQGPHLVDPVSDKATRVGDEPLLLAQVAPTWISRDRVKGAIAMVEAGAKAILMDDGFQNPSLLKDISLCVIDGTYGIGNGRVMPAGPLREEFEHSLQKSNAIVIMGTDRTGMVELIKETTPDIVLLKAQITAKPINFDIINRPIHAFAGIGHPDKFFNMLRELGCDVIKSTPFADHHIYEDTEVSLLVEAAKSDKALLLTTEKDYVRLDRKWHIVVKPISISLTWENEPPLKTLLEPIIHFASNTENHHVEKTERP